MTPRAATLALLGAAALAGCGALDPYPTVAHPPQPGQPAGPRVAVCYNALNTPRAAVQTEAQRECPAGTVAEAVDTDWYLQQCPLLLPAHASFVCAPGR